MQKIAIGGISVRLPKSNNIDEFAHNLYNGVDMISDSSSRWIPGLYGLPTRLGIIQDVNKFAYTLFGIESKRASLMEPCTRLLLEVAYEAILDAGIHPDDLRESRTGVYIGVSKSSSNTQGNNSYSPAKVDSISNAISYQFSLNGPSLDIDSACSSSMVALHSAITAIKAGHCKAAIVGGVNLCLNPKKSLHYMRLNLLAKDGKCKVFDSSADGFVTSESVVVIYITLAQAACRNYATILHCKTGNDGYKELGILHPSRQMQTQLISKAYAEANINPLDVQYCEAHGTGTAAGDSEELNAIFDIFCQQRDAKMPLLVGSVKSNMGHGEAAAGLCSIAKVIISMKESIIPQSINFKMGIACACESNVLKLVVANTQWTPKLVGINSFGWGGTNVHIILIPGQFSAVQMLTKSLPVIIPFLGFTEARVREALSNIQSRSGHETIRMLQNICQSRSLNFPIRGCKTVGNTIQKDPIQIRSAHDQDNVWIVFPGIGSTINLVDTELLQILPFRSSIDNSAKTLQAYDFDLNEVLFTTNSVKSLLSDMVATIAIQLAFIDTLMTTKIQIRGFIGHSAGEIACAYADGCLTAGQAIETAYLIGTTLMNLKLNDGLMASVGLSWNESLVQCPDGIYTSCNNAQKNVTISGLHARVELFLNQLETNGIYVKRLNTRGVPFHCKYIYEAEKPMLACLKNVIPQTIKLSKWVSTFLPNNALTEMFLYTYFVKNLISPVLFYEALVNVPANGVAIEISASPVFQNVLKASLKNFTVLYLGTKRCGTTDSVFDTLSKMFLLGLYPDFSGIYNSIKFPISISTPFLSPMFKWNYCQTLEMPTFSQMRSTTIRLCAHRRQKLSCHQIHGNVYFPPAGYLYIVWKLLASYCNSTTDNMPIVFESVTFHRLLGFKAAGYANIQIQVLSDSGRFYISESNTPVAEGVAFREENCVNDSSCRLQVPTENIILKKQNIYKTFEFRGISYTGIFRSLKCIYYTSKVSCIEWNSNWFSFLDGIFQTREFFENQQLTTPIGLEKLIIYPQQIFKSGQQELLAECDKTRNIVKTIGLEMRGLTVCPLPFEVIIGTNTLRIHSPFVGYNYQTNTENISREETLDFMFRLMLENCSGNSVIIVEIILENASAILKCHRKYNIVVGNRLIDCRFIFFVSAACSKCHEMTEMNRLFSNVVYHTIERIEDVVMHDNTDIVIVPDFASAVFINKLLKQNAFVLIHGCVEAETIHSLSLISHKICETEHYFLFRKDVCPGKIMKPRSLICDVRYDNLWARKLKTALTSKYSFSNCSSLFIYAPLSLVDAILDTILFYKSKLREIKQINVVISDMNCRFEPDVQQLASEVSHLAASNIMLNIRYKGVWGTFYSDTPKYDLLRHKIIYLLNNVHVNFIFCIALRLEYDILGSSERFVLEYAGIRSGNKKVMGLGICQEIPTLVRFDKCYMWDIPEKWTFSEAVGVPWAYTTAYYALRMHIGLHGSETILITSVKTAVEIAAILICLSMKCTVYTTVIDKDLFSLQAGIGGNELENIKFVQPYNIEYQILKLTEGEGVDIVLNVGHADTMQLVRCVRRNGKYIQVETNKYRQNKLLSLSVFLNNIDFYHVSTDCVFTLSETEKLKLKLLVGEGIRSLVVRPFKQQIIALKYFNGSSRQDNVEIGKSIIKLRCSNLCFGNAIQDRAFCFNPNKVYVLLKGVDDLYLSVAEWMVRRGCRQLYIVSSQKGSIYQKLFEFRFREVGVKVYCHTCNTACVSAISCLPNIAVTNIGTIGGAVCFFKVSGTKNVGVEKLNNIDRFISVLQKNIQILSTLQYSIVAVIGFTSKNDFYENGTTVCNLGRRSNFPVLATICYNFCSNVLVLTNGDPLMNIWRYAPTKNQCFSYIIQYIEHVLTIRHFA